MLVHVLQHVLNAYLLAVANAPHAVELQALDDGTLEDEHSRSTRATDEVDTLGRQLGNGLGEYGVMLAGEQSDTVRSDEGSTILGASVQDALFQLGTGGSLLAKSCGDDDKGTRLLLASQQFHRIRTELGRDDEHGQFGGRQFLGIVEHLDALYLVLLGIDNTEGALITTLQDVAHNGATWFVYIIGTTDDYDGLRV